MYCCATARSPTRQGAISSAISTSRKQASPIANTGRCRDVRWNQNRALVLCFDAFSSREPVSTSLENALNRPLALDGDTGAGAGMRPVIPHRAVLGAAIVPERNRVLGPAEAALKQRILRVLVEIGQHGIAFVAGDADDVVGEAAIDV